MRLDFCVACGRKDGLNHHHLVPRVHDGSDDESNLVTLCRVCHGLFHGAGWSNAHAELTKAGLAAAKRRGVKLGGHRGTIITKAMSRAAAEAIARRADARAVDLAPTIAELQAAGATSLRAIAAGLNERGIPTARGGQWSAVQVQRVISRPFESVAAA
jgi:hypothetical protein